ncbi:MAG: DUF3418 domain-containing protein [Desulfamplus sp.]|nr:DUF3418 domain-containing protein [Desulfamplus sp.]
MGEAAIKIGKKHKSVFKDKVMELLPNGGNLNACLTCGACASGCPATGLEGMDPRKFLRMAALGMDEEGVRNLFILCYENDINALKKDIKGASRLKGYASFFGGLDRLNRYLLGCITKHLFSCDIRSRDAFESHAALMLPRLYSTGQELISRVTELCEEYKSAVAVIKSISLKNLNLEAMFTLMGKLEQNLEEIVPQNFLEIYHYDRIAQLKRYVAAIRIRAQRAAVDPVRDQKRWSEVSKYVDRFNLFADQILSNSLPDIPSSGGLSSGGLGLSSGRVSSGVMFERLISAGAGSTDGTCWPSSQWSKEKIDAVVDLFWMIEEYKVSLFAQELKTAVKISPKRLDKICEEIERMF